MVQATSSAALRSTPGAIVAPLIEMESECVHAQLVARIPIRSRASTSPVVLPHMLLRLMQSESTVTLKRHPNGCPS